MAQELGRVVFSRDRYARSWSLGDRSNPKVKTPILIQLRGDPELDESLAPFKSYTDDKIPATITLESKLNLSPPDFSIKAPNWQTSIGHVLPPSLEEADAGEPAKFEMTMGMDSKIELPIDDASFSEEFQEGGDIDGSDSEDTPGFTLVVASAAIAMAVFVNSRQEDEEN